MIETTSEPALAGNGLVTKPSKYGAQEIVEKFEAAIKPKAAGAGFSIGSITPQSKPASRRGHARRTGFEKRGVSEDEAERRAWATMNKETHGGKKSGSGRGKSEGHSPSRKGGHSRGKASASRPRRRGLRP